MRDTIFYSWQSDLPNATNRGFIGKALENAAKSLRQDASLEVEPVIDRDTAGVPGAPDIAATIFEKIAAAQVFVCDASIVNQVGSKSTPNPNVLIEFGYALRALGPQRIVIVVNQAFGQVEQLPFDLGIKRAVTYSMREEDKGRAPARQSLENQLIVALRTIFEAITAQRSQEAPLPVSPGDQARQAVENDSADQAISVTGFMEWLIGELDRLNPVYSNDVDHETIFIEALERTPPLVIELARLAQTIARMDSRQAALALYRAFEPLLQRYDHRPDDSTTFWQINGHAISYDFYKFIGHELFVVFFSFLIRERRWELIADLLENEFYLTNGLNGRARNEPYTYVNQWIAIPAYRSQRLQQRFISPHGEMLRQRYSQYALAQVVPFQQFIEADLFFFIRSNEPEREVDWTSRSTLYLEDVPRYLVEAQRQRYAMQLLRPLAASDLGELKDRIETRKKQHVELFGYRMGRNALDLVKVEEIGRRQP